MKVVTLIENTSGKMELACEHGLSLYIETGEYHILFDAGQSGAFADNAEKLGIDLRKVDFAVLSHGHYDHGGGLARFLEINSTAPVYLRKEALEPHFNAASKNIGLDRKLLDSGRLVFVDEDTEIVPGIRLLSCNDRKPLHRTDGCGMQTLCEERLIPDDFRHEQYLIVAEKGKTICFSGCSHKGILNIVDWLRPDVLFGGFHFMKLDLSGGDSRILSAAAHGLRSYPTAYYTGHCTGTAQFEFLKRCMGQQLNALAAGVIVQLPEY